MPLLIAWPVGCHYFPLDHHYPSPPAPMLASTYPLVTSVLPTKRKASVIAGRRKPVALESRETIHLIIQNLAKSPPAFPVDLQTSLPVLGASSTLPPESVLLRPDLVFVPSTIPLSPLESLPSSLTNKSTLAADIPTCENPNLILPLVIRCLRLLCGE